MTSSEKDRKVSDLFDDGFDLYQKICKSDEPTNSGNLQMIVRKSINLLEDSTKLVSLIGLFSINEDIEEISTADLKLLLLPALLGQLTLKLCTEDRLNIIETAEIYFKDFLQRCKDYGITDIDLRNNEAAEENSQDSATALAQINARPDLIRMAQDRNVKLQRYREQKALEEELSKLRQVISNCQCDEEVRRNYFLKLIKSFVNQSLDELRSIEMEKPILAHMAKVRGPGTLGSQEVSRNIDKPLFKTPLNAVIITKDEVQKSVFGAGYPSLPRMSVAEFYESRVQDGTFRKPSAVQISVLADKAKNIEETKLKEEEEIAHQESLVEQDDPENLARARAMDEYKDEFKRGWGNRYNRS